MTVGLQHDALIYESDAEFVDALAPFVREGLERGEQVLAVTTPANQANLARSLGSRADDVRFIDSQQWYQTPARTIAAYHSAINDGLKSGANRLRVIGEVDFGTTEIEHAEWTRYESVLNVAFGPRPAWIVCPYDVRRLPDRIIDDARRTHPHAIAGGERLPVEQFTDPAHFAGALPLPTPDRLLGQVEHDGRLRTVLQLVEHTCGQVGLTGEQVTDLNLAVGELATNAMEHGVPPVQVRAFSGKDSLVYEISDAGEGPTDPWVGFVPPQPNQIRGRGLWLARQLADRVEIASTPRGTSARVEVRLPR
ncbi:sensor histidine kinase [Skermania sp. ID1734]|uniref:sensor histidine kinase n=1 Tax=Skermania sp. ID1734 TaxID=2597516 RepID=UPI00117C8E9F|nr:sensor histidine kinase [Skermania sp. ID1734]TSD94279.1 sensor histidine kinase [Skermania sp. ID1734]